MFRRFTPTDYKVMPWKNGGGSTTELHMEPGSDGLLWRVSIADVGSDGPFSRFAGCERHIMTIEGHGMVLSGGPGGDIAVAPILQPKSFSGDWPITARLINGPVRDFNLIVRRDFGEARLECLELPELHRFSGRGSWYLYLLGGIARAEAASGSAILNSGESCLCHEPLVVTPLATGAPAILAVCNILPARRND
jgi:environmental stress-induced protein Ves